MTETSGQIYVRDLWVSYRRLFRRDVVLRGITLVAHHSEVTALVGRNGVGKTTLFRTILGFHSPDRGEITIEGLPSGEYRRRRGIGHVPDGAAFPPGWTVRDVLSRGTDLAVTPQVRRDAFSTAVRRAGFDDGILGKSANACSTGIQQRLRLAFALIGEPAIVLLDEPFAGLDPPSRIQLRDAISSLSASGKTVLMASHDLSEVAKLADKVLVMADGKVRPGPEAGGGDLDLELELESTFTDDV